MSEGMRAERRRRIESVLGKAVHPAAIDRLLELWPEAAVYVRHYRDWQTDGGTRAERVTRVYIYQFKPKQPLTVPERGQWASEAARCHPDDQFDRRTGIRLAFNRALKAVPR